MEFLCSPGEQRRTSVSMGKKRYILSKKIEDHDSHRSAHPGEQPQKTATDHTLTTSLYTKEGSRMWVFLILKERSGAYRSTRLVPRGEEVSFISHHLDSIYSS